MNTNLDESKLIHAIAMEEILLERELLNTKDEIRELLCTDELNMKDKDRLVMIYQNLNIDNVKEYRKTLKEIKTELYNQYVENENNQIKEFFKTMLFSTTILMTVYLALQNTDIFVQQF